MLFNYHWSYLQYDGITIHSVKKRIVLAINEHTRSGCRDTPFFRMENKIPQFGISLGASFAVMKCSSCHVYTVLL